MSDEKLLQLPLVPLRDMVVFPSMMAPFVVGRRASILALEATLATADKRIFLATQRDPKIDDPSMEEIYQVGVMATVVQNLKLPNQNVKVMVEGLSRAEIVGNHESGGFVTVAARAIDTTYPLTPEVSQYMQKLVEIFEQYAKMSHHLAFEGVMSTLKLDDPDKFADTLASHLLITTSEKQQLLETPSPYERLQKLQDFLEIEIEKINIDKRINSKVKKQMERAQKEYYLNEKIKAIHHELGRKDDRSDEIEELRQKIEEAGMPKETKEKAMQELKRLEAMPGVSAEATVSRNYIEWLVSVPWKKSTKEIKDIDLAEQILNEDHYGLEKIKERCLEFLAVRQLVKQPKGTILCFVGPPGVGKTSLAKSIARATGRKFVRLSLGGVRDEAEIRGHRRTYIGAFPGQIIQRMKKAGTINPVFLLDEVDKMSMDFRGDPSAALLEVLDPEQNNQFVDHYLDVEYDLSKVMFIATANVTHTIPAPLKDRMEIIGLSGYTHLEKLAIGRQFLVPKQRTEQGLEEAKITWEDSALEELIDSYTREAGVRNLEREVGSVLRKVARQVLQHGPEYTTTVDRSKVRELLGKPKFRSQTIHDKSEIGLATGLAWTEVGGEILSTEVALSRGKGNLTLTGKLGDVMQESARAALSYVRSRAELFGLDPDFHASLDIHIHVPEGAIPKDGPSAGITMATALLSSVTKIPVHRDIAMTGEITLRGKVLPVGGVKDKILAAARAGIFRVVLPADNERDLEEIPADVREKMEFHLVASMDEVVSVALDGTIVPLAAKAKLPEPEKVIGSEPPVTH
ncbi:MAG TPA: endopeptidase La [Thermoanaerobaculia bacterium]|jgi:ATP-dependent Lon protease|nr:endopeptidase La [Thermoanaerobaculia bacterium]